MTQASVRTSPLQLYPGYSEADVHLLEEFRVPDRNAEPGFIVDFLGVRTRVTSLADSQRAFEGVLDIPVPGDYHAEAIEYIGLLKSVLRARDQFVVLELGAGWGPWLVAGAKAARFGLPEVKLGILPGFGGTQRLTRLVGRGVATELILHGGHISAERALAIGLANELVEPDALLPRAVASLWQDAQPDLIAEWLNDAPAKVERSL